MANPSVTLAIYEIRLRKPHKKEDYYSVSDFDYGSDLLKFLHETIANWAYIPSKDNVIVKDEDKQKIVRLLPGSLSLAGRILSATVETGDYGVSSSIIDSDSGKEMYQKTKNDADVLPFFAMFYVPKDGAKSAIMISQRFKQFGATSIIQDTIKKAFKEQHPAYYMEICPLISRELSDRFTVGGDIKRITFRSFDSKYLQDIGMSIPSLNTGDYTLEFTIKAKRGRRIPFSLDYFRSNKDNKEQIAQLVKLPAFDYNEISFNIHLNGHERTIKVENIDSLASFFDITSDVMFNDNGLPTPESVKKQAKMILDDIIKL